MGIRRELMEKGSRIEVEREEIVVGRVRIGKRCWRVIGIYHI